MFIESTPGIWINYGAARAIEISDHMGGSTVIWSETESDDIPDDHVPDLKVWLDRNYEVETDANLEWLRNQEIRGQG